MMTFLFQNNKELKFKQL